MIFSREISTVIVRYAQTNTNSGTGTEYLRGGWGGGMLVPWYGSKMLLLVITMRYLSRVLDFISAIIFTLFFNFFSLLLKRGSLATQSSPSPKSAAEFWLEIYLLQPHATSIHQNVNAFCFQTSCYLPGLLHRFLTFLIWGPVRDSE